MKFIDEDYMIDASEALCLTRSCFLEERGSSPLQVTNLETEADTQSLASSPRIISHH